MGEIEELKLRPSNHLLQLITVSKADVQVKGRVSALFHESYLLPVAQDGNLTASLFGFLLFPSPSKQNKQVDNMKEEPE